MIFSDRKPKWIQAKSGFGVWGVWGTICTVNFIERMAQKLCRIILLHLGLITFRFHFGKTRKPIMIFGLGRRVRDSQSQQSLTLDTPDDSKQFKKIPIHFENYYFWNLKILGLYLFVLLEKAGTEDPSDKFLKTLNMGSISSRKHALEAEYWMWEQYL